jgi:hypothetical protein
MASSSATPQSFIIAAHAFCELWGNGIAIDRYKRVGRFATTDFLGDPLAQIIHWLGHQVLQPIPVRYLGVTLEFFAFAPRAIANLRRLGSQIRVVEQLFHVAHPIGPLAEPFAGDRVPGSAGRTSSESFTPVATTVGTARRRAALLRRLFTLGIVAPAQAARPLRSPLTSLAASTGLRSLLAGLIAVTRLAGLCALPPLLSLLPLLVSIARLLTGLPTLLSLAALAPLKLVALRFALLTLLTLGRLLVLRVRLRRVSCALALAIRIGRGVAPASSLGVR